ncbi:MAG TPA: peptidoglycan-binding protein [Mycobacteriales bacterium]|nr:peptidoglycan-binding protein [Mycobacteriales bacterium]
MLIFPSDLDAQYQRAVKAWPFFDQIARAAGVPRFLLHAVGSRETNLTNERGDGGHGHGVFQLDDRWHTIPAGFDTDVALQAKAAASMLSSLIKHYNGQLYPAVCAYNAGVGNVDAGIKYHGDPDYWTTHSQGVGYGAEVMARFHWLRGKYGPPPVPPWYHRVLRKGSVGSDVTAMKRRLAAHGYRGMVLNPFFGRGADKALRAFQTAQKITPDGACGPTTARRLG